MPARAILRCAVALVGLSVLWFGFTPAAIDPDKPVVFDGTVSVTVVRPITISEDRALSFGTIIAPSGPGARNRYSSAGQVQGSGGGSVVAAGTGGLFTITGEPGSAFSGRANAAGACSDSRVMLHLETEFPSAHFPASGRLSVQIDAAIGVTNAVDGAGPQGVVTCRYTVSAEYH
jgi:Domain of unknown function (DUF4402)